MSWEGRLAVIMVIIFGLTTTHTIHAQLTLTAIVLLPKFIGQSQVESARIARRGGSYKPRKQFSQHIVLIGGKQELDSHNVITKNIRFH